MNRYQTDLHRRPGVTLVELLVVISILATLATLTAIFVVPAFRDNKNVIRGLDRVTTTLLIAKQRALRDQGPRGVRFITRSHDDATPASTISTQMQFIEQPEPYSSGRVTSIAADNTITPGGFRLTFDAVDFFGGAASGATDEYLVRPPIGNTFDYFRYKSGTSFTVRILGVPAANQLILPSYTPALTAPLAVGSWEIIRQARAIAGEDRIDLPTNVGVHITLVTEQGATNQIPGPPYDIMFDPAGGVMNSPSRPTVLWVCDLSQQKAEILLDPGRSRMLSINPRTGSIAGHPLGPTTDYLQYARDGRSSGM